MASQINPICDFSFGFLYCDLPEDTIGIDLKIRTIQGINTYKEDSDSRTNKFRPWGLHVTPFKPLKEKMVKFIRREATTTATTPSCHEV